MRLDKFTIKAQEALAAARDLADQRAHQEVTPEHLLRALVSQEDGVVLAVLRKLGSDAEAIGREVDEALDKQPQVRGSSADGFVGRRMKDLLEEATRQSVEFKDEYVSSEHLLLGMLAGEDGFGIRFSDYTSTYAVGCGWVATPNLSLAWIHEFSPDRNLSAALLSLSRGGAIAILTVATVNAVIYFRARLLSLRSLARALLA